MYIVECGRSGNLLQGVLDCSMQCAEGDLATLLRLRATFLDFDMVSRTEDSHWDASLPMCQWQGVTCTPQGFVQALNFSIPARAPPVLAPLRLGYDDSIVHASMELQLRGQSPHFLLYRSPR